jgi:hypothetical protein
MGVAIAGTSWSPHFALPTDKRHKALAAAWAGVLTAGVVSLALVSPAKDLATAIFEPPHAAPVSTAPPLTSNEVATVQALTTAVPTSTGTATHPTIDERRPVIRAHAPAPAPSPAPAATAPAAPATAPATTHPATPPAPPITAHNPLPPTSQGATPPAPPVPPLPGLPTPQVPVPPTPPAAPVAPSAATVSTPAGGVSVSTSDPAPTVTPTPAGAPGVNLVVAGNPVALP